MRSSLSNKKFRRCSLVSTFFNNKKGAGELEKLIDLDFAPGVRDSDINANFSLLHDWITRERLRTGGWGIVEGFDLYSDMKEFTITVGEGVVVSPEGEEIRVPKKIFHVGPPEYEEVTEEVEVNEDGYFSLSSLPYSSIDHGYIDYEPPTIGSRPVKDIFSITDVLSEQDISVLSISGHTVMVSKTAWAGNKVRVKYLKTANRIDSILIKPDGSYIYERSIDSTNPSHVDLADYKNTFCVAVVYWTIDSKTSVQFYTEHRSYRSVYTNKNNELYLNGKRYQEAKFIYFEEPENPQVNDVWYDTKTNTLMVWEEKNNEYGWVPMNDHSEIMVREHKIWTPEDSPKDLQTFRFTDEEVNLFYVPNTNALSIIIDNAPLMQDQFEEIVIDQPRDYLSTGRGFRLKNPLERPTYVELIVNHVVQQRPVRETFQRSAVFASENHEYMTESNTKQVFQTDVPYVIGEDQLEVFLDGARLIHGVDFKELNKNQDEVSAKDKDTMTTWFKVTKKLKPQQIVNYKITKHIWSYDQLNTLLTETENASKEAVNQCAALRADLTNTNGSIRTRFNDVQTSVDAINGKLDVLNQFIKKTDKIDRANLPADIIQKLFGHAINLTVPAEAMTTIENVTLNDFLQVYYVSDDTNRILVKDKEYILQEDGPNLKLSLSDALISSVASLYVTGIKIGG